MKSNYLVTRNVEDNRIYIRLKSGENVEKKIQIFSPEQEFPFLYAGSVTLSTEYDVWIAPVTGGDRPDWKTTGAVIRILNETEIEEEIFVRNENDRTRVLFVTPHLSTGGCPQYLLKKIETFSEDLESYVYERDYLSSTYIVQRNRILNLIGSEKFYSHGEFNHDLLEVIRKVRPEIVHFEEIPETFLPLDLVDKIYTDPHRSYFITETTHSSNSSTSQKYFLPDKFIFCSKYSQEKFKSLNVPSEIWEYPIENRKRPNRKQALKKLGLDPKCIHVLNVGLFTPGKNQSEILAVARTLSDEKIKFHFVGNQASNFAHFWEPLMKDKPDNCIVWGERDDVEDFMKACDVFYFSSVLELNPLVVKEALSWKMPVLMYNLHTYMGSYDETLGVNFLKTQADDLILSRREQLLEVLHGSPDAHKILSGHRRCKIVHIVSEITSEIEQASIRSVSQLGKFSETVDYTLHYNPPTKEIPIDKISLYPEGQNGSLKPGHFGCFEAFRKAIVEDFTDDYDFLVICERDCILEKTPEEVFELMIKTFRLMESHDIMCFSFGDKVDLDNGYLQSEKLIDLPGDFAFLTQKIIGLQFVIFSFKGVEFLREEFNEKGWYGMDIWLNTVFSEKGEQMGILNQRATTQLDGYSIIDDKNKIFKANKK